MTNREWLNTLSDEEFVKWGRKFFGTDWDSASVVMSDKEIAETSIKILNQPHETTADEDFAEIGFEYKYEMRDSDDKKYIKYSDKNMRLLYIYEEGGNEYDRMDGSKLLFTDELIDQIRTIADKKRKEMGWK